MNGAKVSADVLASEHPELGLLIQSLGKNESIELEIKTNNALTVRIASAWNVQTNNTQHLDLDLLLQASA